MKKQKNLTVKIMAGLALWAILVSVVWTGILFVYEAYFNSPAQVGDISPEELERLLEELQLEWGQDFDFESELNDEDVWELWDAEKDMNQDEAWGLEDSVQVSA